MYGPALAAMTRTTLPEGERWYLCVGCDVQWKGEEGMSCWLCGEEENLQRRSPMLNSQHGFGPSTL